MTEKLGFVCKRQRSVRGKERSCCARGDCVLKLKRIVGILGHMRSVLRNHGSESFLVTKPAIVPNPSKCIPVVGGENNPLS